MNYRTVKANSYNLIKNLDENIFDGQYSSDVDLDELKNIYIDQIELQSNDICVNEDDNLIIGKTQDWDSNYFGFNCYRIEYFKQINHNLIEENIDTYLAGKNVKLAYIRVNVDNHLNFLIHKKLRLMSTKLMYKKSIENKEKSELLHTIKDLNNAKKKKVIEKIVSLTPSLFYQNRFIYDKNIDNNKAIGLYQSWVISSSKNNQNNFYLLSNNVGDLIAFCIINIIDIFNSKFARIDMIGSLIKGQNIGTKIIEELVKSLNEQNISILYANTEIRNYKAQNLYTKNGFKVYNAICEYHYWV